jgi:hypothetical protein
MDIEQLKLVLEMVKGIADGATSIAIWYIVLSFGLKFLGQLVCWSGVLASIYFIASAFKTNNDDTAFVKELRDTLSPSGYGWVDESDRKTIRQVIFDLQAKANDTKTTPKQ